MIATKAEWRSFLADGLGFGGSNAVYGVALALGVLATVIALIARRLHGMPEIRLSSMDVVGSGDLDEVILPKESVYLSPSAMTSLDCRDEPLILLRFVTVVGIGLSALALFGLVSQRWLGPGLERLLASSAVGLVAALITYSRSGRWFFGPSTSTVACADVVGAPGEVTVPIPQDSFGAVAATIRGTRMTFSARAEGQSVLSRGTPIRVVEWTGGRVVVVPVEVSEPSSSD